MAATILTEEEYQYLISQEKDLTTRANAEGTTARMATHLRAVAKLHSDFIAIEDGKRAAQNKRNTTKAQREQEKLQRQATRLAKMQAELNKGQATQPGGATGNAGRQNKAEKSA